VFAYAIAEGRRVMRPAHMFARSQSWTPTLLGRNEKHQSLPALRDSEASV
jgi:hypothetical protein